MGRGSGGGSRRTAQDKDERRTFLRQRRERASHTFATEIEILGFTNVSVLYK